MTARERAIALLKEKKLAHVIYGYQTAHETAETAWETNMEKFVDDDSFNARVDQMYSNIPGLELILAVHA